MSPADVDSWRYFVAFCLVMILVVGIIAVTRINQVHDDLTDIKLQQRCEPHCSVERR